MDDLLIVRMSDRSKERYSRKGRVNAAPVGMHFGLLIGIGFGLALASATKSDPIIGIAIGTALGLVLGALTGRFLKPNRRFERRRSAYDYEGMPFEAQSDEGEPQSPTKNS